MLRTCVRVKPLQSCLTLCNPVERSPQGSPAGGILQAMSDAGVGYQAPLQRVSLTQGALKSLALAGGFFTTSARGLIT